jgi:hypothetical protein
VPERQHGIPVLAIGIDGRPVYHFSVYHTAELDDPTEPFPSNTGRFDMSLIKDVTKVCKSKNAGPFELTIDVMFDNADTFCDFGDTDVYRRQQHAALLDVDVPI